MERSRAKLNSVTECSSNDFQLLKATWQYNFPRSLLKEGHDFRDLESLWKTYLGTKKVNKIYIAHDHNTNYLVYQKLLSKMPETHFTRNVYCLFIFLVTALSGPEGREKIDFQKIQSSLMLIFIFTSQKLFLYI